MCARHRSEPSLSTTMNSPSVRDCRARSTSRPTRSACGVGREIAPRSGLRGRAAPRACRKLSTHESAASRGSRHRISAEPSTKLQKKKNSGRLIRYKKGLRLHSTSIITLPAAIWIGKHHDKHGAHPEDVGDPGGLAGCRALRGLPQARGDQVAHRGLPFPRRPNRYPWASRGWTCRVPPAGHGSGMREVLRGAEA